MKTRTVRRSIVLRKLQSNNVVICAKINILDPKVIELAAMCGFECVWLDMEHVLCDWMDIQHQVRAAKIHDIDVLVRTERGSYSDYIKPFEADATGVMVPHVLNSEEAKQIVNFCRFSPIGRRAIDGGNADGAFTMISSSEYRKGSNEEKFIILQIEDPEAVDNLEDIASVPGYDMLFFGPGDYCHAIGADNPWNDPRVCQARKAVSDTARKYGKFAGTVADPQQVKLVTEMGYSFLIVCADLCLLRDAFKQRIADCVKEI
jgi:4-hydroxy-2-oxoheptanedioate aldolase